MKAEEAIGVLQEHAATLRARGVRHAALFGSVARNEARPGSDVDILIELDPEAPLDAFDYADLKHYIASLFPVPVDVVNRDGLKPHVKTPAARDTVYAF